MESFLKKQPRWLQLLIAGIFFGVCIFIIAFKVNSFFVVEKGILTVPSLSQFKQVNSENWSKPDFQEVDKAIAVFAQQCPAYLQYPNEVTLQNVSLESNDYTHDDLGWTRFVRIEVIASQSPKNLTKISPYIRGHHCFHDIGIDGEQGMSISKSMCVEVCGGESL